MTEQDQDYYGVTSPGGFIFGVQGWTWGEPRPRTITFFLDGTVKVCDQHGRPIKGCVVDGGKQVKFALTAPSHDDPPTGRTGYATHAQVVAALAAERIDWRTLTWSGWPQLPYDDLKQVPALPPTPIEELRKIKDPALRKDSLRVRREIDTALAREMGATDDE